MFEDNNSEWRSATNAEVSEIVREDLVLCDPEQVAAYERYRVDPYRARIIRYGQLESVVVVAQNGSEVIYWEDVEDGFNMSPISSDGQILEHWCNQDELGFALNAWIEGRWWSGKIGPAASTELI
jgi:hypothetical protein